jgi:phage/plasmid-associated DNA primase
MNSLENLNNKIIISFELDTIEDDKGKITKEYKCLPVAWAQLEKSFIKEDKKHNGRGLLTGEKAGITVIDFDDINYYNKTCEKMPIFKECLRVQTRKGMHCYFKYSDKIKNLDKIIDGIDIDCKNTGGFITIPPTTYEYGEQTITYTEIKGKFEEIPEQFYKLLKTKAIGDNTAEVKQERKEKQEKQEKKINIILDDDEREAFYDDVDFILSKLDEDRFNDYDSWLHFCFLLKNLDLTNDQRNELFIKYSSKSKKFNKSKDLEMFNNTNKREDGYTFKSLEYWFKCDNYEEFIKWNIKIRAGLNKDNNNFFEYPFGLEFLSGEIADYFKSVYEDRFVYCDNKLYYFNGVYWETDDKNTSFLSNFIDEKFFKHCSEFQTKNEIELKKLIIKNQNDDRLPKLKEISNDYSKKIKNNFRKIVFRKSLIQDIINKLTNNKQAKEFNKQPNLLCFKNKLFDLKQRKFIVPKSSYYISWTTGYDYIDDEKTKTCNITELNKILDTIFNKENRKSYFSVLSSGLIGELVQKFNIASGAGGNGKSLINKLMMETVGEYGYKLSPQILQQKLKVGACPEIANLHLKRFVLTSEPDSEFDINCSVLKQLTGDDEINARDLFSSNTKTELCLTLVMECNDRPKLNEVNQAILRRMNNQPFINKFVDEYQYNTYTEEERKEQNIFLGNSNYEKREFKETYKQALFDILVNNHLEDYYKNGIYKSQDVIKESNKYLSDSDMVFNFINENYQTTKDKKEYIKCLDLWEKFKNTDEYLKMPRIAQRKLNKSEFIKRLENNLFIGKYIKMNTYKVLCLYGYEETGEELTETKFKGLDL